MISDKNFADWHAASPITIQREDVRKLASQILYVVLGEDVMHDLARRVEVTRHGYAIEQAIIAAGRPTRFELRTGDELPCEAADAEREWPLRDVLTLLADFADDRLTRRDYDGHGHEALRLCVQRAREIVAAGPLSCPCSGCAAAREGRHTGDNAHNCCRHDASVRCCDNAVPASVPTPATAWAVFDGQRLEAISLDRDAARDEANALCRAGKHGDYRRVRYLAPAPPAPKANTPERCRRCGWRDGRRPSTCHNDGDHDMEPIPEAEWTEWDYEYARPAAPKDDYVGALRRVVKERDEAQAVIAKVRYFAQAETGRDTADALLDFFGKVNVEWRGLVDVARARHDEHCSVPMCSVPWRKS